MQQLPSCYLMLFIIMLYVYKVSNFVLFFFRDRLRTGANIASITFGGIVIHVVCKDSLGLASNVEQSDTEEKTDCHQNGNIIGRPV